MLPFLLFFLKIFFSFSLSVLLKRILNSETRMMLTCGKDKKPM